MVLRRSSVSPAPRTGDGSTICHASATTEAAARPNRVHCRRSTDGGTLYRTIWLLDRPDAATRSRVEDTRAIETGRATAVEGDPAPARAAGGATGIWLRSR